MAAPTKIKIFCRSNIKRSETLVIKKVLINSVSIKAINMANPPVRGIGFVCTFRDEGISTAPKRVPNLPIKGLRIRERIKEMPNITRRVVIGRHADKKVRRSEERCVYSWFTTFENSDSKSFGGFFK